MPSLKPSSKTKKIPSILLCMLLLKCSVGLTDEATIFRIGTGGSAGTYFPIGSLLAELFSSNYSNEFSPHHISNFIAVAQRSNGSVANVKDLNSGLLEAAFVQADIAYWAFTSSGPFENDEAIKNLRSIATLYLESLHLVVRKGSNIKSVSDLKGKRVSLDEVGSGTQRDISSILAAFDLDERMMRPVYLKPSDAIDRLSKNQLDAFFLIAGYPVPSVMELIDKNVATVIPIEGKAVEKLTSMYPFFTIDIIPANTYDNKNPIKTLSVAAQFLVNSNLPYDLAFKITGKLWNEEGQIKLTTGHPKGHDIRLETALVGLDIPLHPGASRLYRDLGLTIPPSLEHFLDR